MLLSPDPEYIVLKIIFPIEQRKSNYQLKSGNQTMEEIEVPTEQLQEQLNERTRESQEKWILMVALTAILAVFAAINALLAGHYANEAMIEQLKASDQWAYYQAKGIKYVITESKIDLLQQMGREASPRDIEKANQYKEDQKEIDKTAREKETSSFHDLALHNKLAKGVTVFQVAIAICAISALTRRKWLWYGSILLGITGIILFGMSFF
jgi:tRNA nucleotidyltransferase/poly(A) polymerase